MYFFGSDLIIKLCITVVESVAWIGYRVLPSNIQKVNIYFKGVVHTNVTPTCASRGGGP